MAVRELRTDEVELYRSLRLAALRTDPGAFASNADREAGFDESEWQRRLGGFGDRPGVVYVDEVDGEPVGMTGVGDDGDRAFVWGMWVDPAARGRGSGRRLLEAAAGWAASTGSTELCLWVMRQNDSAIALYTTAGFEPVDGDTPPAPPGCTDEQFMRRPL